MKTDTLPPELLHKMDACWRATNYLSVGQICLYDNPMLKHPLALMDVKYTLLGYWGTTPGQNFIYVDLNRVIKTFDLDMNYVFGPSHGGPAVVGNTSLEGTYSEIHPDVGQDEAGLQKPFLQFSFPANQMPAIAEGEVHLLTLKRSNPVHYEKRKKTEEPRDHRSTLRGLRHGAGNGAKLHRQLGASRRHPLGCD